MSGISKLIIVGHIGKDPDVLTFDSGKKLARFPVAVTEKFTSNGEEKEHTEWFNIEAWSFKADYAQKYLIKGQEVYIEGSFKNKKYPAKDGTEKTYYFVTAQNIQCLGGIKSLSVNSNETPSKPSPEIGDPPAEEPPTDDLPF